MGGIPSDPIALVVSKSRRTLSSSSSDIFNSDISGWIILSGDEGWFDDLVKTE